MKFRLDYSPPESPDKVSHASKVFLAGSCFAGNIGDKLKEHRFQCTVNPGGIHFDPLGMCRFLNAALSGEVPSGDHFLERGGRCFSFDFHSSVDAGSEEELAARISAIYASTKAALLDADFIFLSFGTALVHYLKEGERPVANCHKQPAQLFSKRLLEAEELYAACSALVSAIRKVNHKTKVILTVSPVKYLRDGPVNNNLSKATLLLLTSRLCARDGCFYFPAFELLNDDLRDYRFYKEDLAHPNDQAISYIWEKFISAFFSPLTQNVVSEIGKLNRTLAHRPIHVLPAEEDSLKASIQKQKERIIALDPAVRL